MTTQVIYITWQERGHTNIHQEYVGGGIYATRANETLITKRARWSDEITPAMLARAEAYIRENMQDDRLNVRAVIVTEPA